MWLSILIVCFLARLIDGNLDPRVDATPMITLRLGNYNYDVTSDNFAEQWSKGNTKENENLEDRTIDSSDKDISNGREMLESKFGFYTRNKVFPKTFRWKKKSWFSWRPKKSLSFSITDIPDICKLIRIPVHNWGGKRSEMYPQSRLNSQQKEIRSMIGRYDRNTISDGFDGTKRGTEKGKINWKRPFDSWGGKRARTPVDKEEFLHFPEVTRFLGTTRGVQNGGRTFRSKDDGKRVDRMKNSVSHSYDNLVENCKAIPYAILLQLCNETWEDYHKMDKDASDTNDGWTSTFNKRKEIYIPCKKTAFNPWGGKRNF